jgi:predicted adenylyl cyclase CyaB
VPQNLELKARFPELDNAEKIARSLGAHFVGTFRQTDTYFRLANGRLKLREVSSRPAELIYYVRADDRRERYSHYFVLPVSRPPAVKKLFVALFGRAVVVRKDRKLFQFHNARIHLDRVATLGSFLEFEVLLARGTRQARALMNKLKRAFHISPDDVVGPSYADLLLQAGHRKRTKIAK